MAEQNGQEDLIQTLTSDNVLIETNAYQTPVTGELLKSYPKEVWEQFMEFVSSVPFIRNLISPERKRAKDLPRDDKGRIIVDLVNPHILENMDYFRQSALHFQKYGCYTKLKPNSNPNSPFRKWLNEEVRRCWEGMVRPDDGEWVTGYMYFYLNYCPIMLTKTKGNNSKVGSRVQGFPEPWEGVYWRFHYLEQARYGGKYNNFEGGEYAVELSKRGSGKSFSLAGIAAHNFILGESAEARSRITTFIIAANSTYLSGTDGTLTKFVPNIDFCRKHTQFPGHRVVDSPNKVSWVMGYKDRLTGVRSGSLNSVSGIAVDNDPEKVRGKRGNLLWEEFGSFPNFIDTFNIAEYGMKEGGVQYGFSYALGTAGDDDSDFFGAQEILYNPIGYDVYSLPNVWDKPNQGRPHFAFFFPAYVNIKGRYNKDGVSDVVASLLFLLSERYKAKYQTGDPKKIIKVTAEMPITPAEAIIRVTASRFPVTDLMERLMQIDSNPRFYDNVYCGEITINSSGEPEFKPTSAEPIRFFPHKDNKGMAGAVEIFEMPEKDKETGKPFANRYLAGADPYDDDSSGTTSLGSIFILDSWTDRIVAEYTGRPRLAEEFYEICRRLCMFYDARLNYEAHPYSQTVIMANGDVKCWGDVCIGDELLAPDNQTTKVIDIPVDEEMPIYKIELVDGRVVYASDNHIWSVYVNNHPRETVLITTREMMNAGVKNKFGQTSFFIPNGGAMDFMKKDLPIDPYTMGIILSEGCIRGSHCKTNYVQISSCPEDMVEYERLIPYKIKHIGKTGHSYHLYIDNCCSIFDELGLLGSRSETKFIPLVYLRASFDDRLSLLKGLMDGDGCAIKRGSPIYSTTSEKLRDDVMSLCRSLGMNCSFRTIKTTNLDAYQIRIYADRTIFNLSRKVAAQHHLRPKLRGSKANAFTAKTGIKSIEFSHIERGKCVTVDNPDGLYLVGDYVVTHNCNKKGLFSYFSKMHSVYLLTDTLQVLRDKQMVKAQTYGNTAKGTMATEPVNNYGRELIERYLLEQVTVTTKGDDGKETETMIPRLFTLRNRAYIQELASWNPQGNFDRVSANIMLMLLREDRLALYGGHTEKYTPPEDPRANDDYFKNNFDKRFGLDAPQHPLDDYDGLGPSIDFSSLNR